VAKRFAKDLIQALFSDRPEEKRGRFQGSLPRLGCLVGPVPGIDPLFVDSHQCVEVLRHVREAI
jgi:hypothetical protein